MSEIEIIKDKLLSISMATDGGLDCGQEIKEQIETLSAKIEALNPTSKPTSNMDLVQGRWRLLYSTFGLERETTLQRLAFGKLPNIKVSVKGIYQEVYTEGQQYNQLIEFTTESGINGIVTVAGRYKIENSNRLDIEFIETFVLPAANNINMLEFKQALGVEEQSNLSAELKFNGWSDITYLDENLRLMRGNKQNLYVLLREY